MNYLAHAYLSFNNPEVLVGNMISDHVKGRSQYDYPPGVLAGIKLHRAIDEFTDQHPVTKEMMHIFRPAYRLYAGALVDIVYDYCLANDPSQFETEEELFLFSQQTYALLTPHLETFPPKFRGMFPYMASQNWLYNYRFSHGMQKSFAGLVHRASFLTDSETGFQLFLEHEVFFKQQHLLFFHSVKTFASHTMEELLKR